MATLRTETYGDSMRLISPGPGRGFFWTLPRPIRREKIRWHPGLRHAQPRLACLSRQTLAGLLSAMRTTPGYPVSGDVET